MDLAAIIERILERPRVAFVVAVFDAYGKAAGGLLANGLAFTALFAVIPIALVTLGIAGSFIGDPQVQGQLAATLIELFPPLESLITGALEALSTGAVATGIIGLVGLVWTVSQFYVTLDVAFSRIFATEAERDVVRRTVRGFAWVALLVAAVIIVIVVGTLLAAAEALIPGTSPVIGDLVGVLVSLPVLIATAMIVVGLVYRVVPPRTPRWRALAPPAAVVGLVVVILTQLFMFLAPRLVGIAALAGSLAAAFVALAWFSFTFQALLIGAAWVRIRDERLRGVGSALAGAAPAAEPGGGGE